MIGGRTDQNRYIKGYFDELRISNSARYTSNFTVQTSAFASDSNTKLLLHFDGTMGSSTITDSSGTPKTCTITNNAGGKGWLIAPKMGTGCYRNDKNGNGIEFPRGSSPYVNSRPFEFYGDSNFQGVGPQATDFTVEAWVCLDDIGTDNQQFVMHRNAVNNGDWVFWWSSSNGLTWSGDNNTLQQGNTTGWASKTWVHIAGVRHNYWMKLYVNGVEVATNENSKWYDGQASLAVAGVWANGSWSNSGAVQGYMDEVRICNEAKYCLLYTSDAADE